MDHLFCQKSAGQTTALVLSACIGASTGLRKKLRIKPLHKVGLRLHNFVKITTYRGVDGIV